MRLIEVKGPGDRLSETQKVRSMPSDSARSPTQVWIDVLLGAGVEVELCSVVEADETAVLSDSGSASESGSAHKRKKKRRKTVKAKSETPAAKEETPAPQARKKTKVKSETPAPLVKRSVQPADVEIIDVDAMPDTPPRPRKRKA